MIIKAVHFLMASNLSTSVLVVNCDNNAERLQIIDRNTGQLIYHATLLFNRQPTIILPEIYGIEERLLCIALDDDKQFNAAVMDGVKAELIDLNTYDANLISSQ